MSEPSNIHDLSVIITTAIEATANSQKWYDVVDMVSRQFSCPAVLLFEYDAENRSAPIAYGSKRFRDNTDASSLVEAFADGTANDDPKVYSLLSNRSAGHYISETELYGLDTDADLPENAFRDKSLRACGAVSRGGAKLNDVGPCMDVLSLHLRYGTPMISSSLRAEMAFLAPILGKSLETGRIIRSLTQNYGALLEVFDWLDFSAAICKPDGQILFANHRFNELARDRDAISVKNGIVEAIFPRDQSALRSVMENAHNTNARADKLIATIDRRSEKLPFVVKTAPIRDRTLQRHQSQLTLLLILDPEDRDRVNAAGLAAFGRLSPAEVEVCEFLVQGYIATEIAERRDTTPETARGQIKSVSAKLFCRSRLDLFRLAISTSTPLKPRKTPSSPPNGG